MFKFFSLMAVTVSISCLLMIMVQKPHDIKGLDKSINLNPEVKEYGLSPIVKLVDPIQQIACTAFIVDKNYAITAAHCLNLNGKLPDYKLEICYPDFQAITKDVDAVAYDTKSDIGLLKGNFDSYKYLAIDPINEINNNVGYVACGFPHQSHGIICNKFTYDHNDEEEKIVGIARFYHGMSGGPVIDTKTNRAIGIISAMDDQGFSYVVPLQILFGIFPELE